MGKFQFMEAELERLKEANLYRTIKVFQSPQSRRVLLDGKSYLMLSSNSNLSSRLQSNTEPVPAALA